MTTFDELISEYQKAIKDWDADSEPDEPEGEPERDRGCDEMPLGVPR